MKKIRTTGSETEKDHLSGWPDDSPFAIKRDDLQPPDPLLIARRVRDRLLAGESWLISKQIGSAMREPAADEYTRRLRSERRLFGVRYKGEYLHPAFQFLPNGEVHPAMARLLLLLPVTDANWNVAFWFYQPTGWLRGRRPADVFSEDPDAVLLGAEKDFVSGDDAF
jgi:hypothetical protein